MAWGLDLPDLKQLAMNSILYSSMTDQEKEVSSQVYGLSIFTSVPTEWPQQIPIAIGQTFCFSCTLVVVIQNLLVNPSHLQYLYNLGSSFWQVANSLGYFYQHNKSRSLRCGFQRL